MTAKISLISPVYKEKHLAAFILHLNSIIQSDTNVEVIIVTVEDDAINLPILPLRFKYITAAQGRAAQMNAGAKIATGSILWFVHADSILPSNSLQIIRQILGTEKIVAGAFSLRFNSSFYYFKFLARCANIRSQITRIPFGDNAIFISTSVFRSLQAYPNQPLLEDIALMLKLRRSGYKLKIAPQSVYTSIRRWQRRGFIKVTVFNLLLQLLYKCGCSPTKLAKLYSKV